MKVTRRMLVFCLALSMVLTAAVPSTASAAKKTKLNKKNITLKVGKKAKLKVKNTKKKVKWSIKSGKKYISLQKKKKNSVVVKGKKAGTAKVQAKVGKKKLTCKVKVKKNSTSSDKKTEKEKEKDKKKVTGTPGKNVPLPAGATVFKMGTRELALGMSTQDVNTVLGTLSNQEIRTGKSSQGFDTIAFNTEDYSEYLLIYLNNDKVAGICGIGKTMSFDNVSAGNNGNDLSDWTNNSEYSTEDGTVAAKQKKVAASEQAYAFYDALGDNTVYCIQVFDPTNNNVKVVSQNNNNMIYYTANNQFDATVTAGVATEVGHMLNAFRAYRSIKIYTFNANLATCAQNHCNSASGSKIDSRDYSVLLEALLACGVDPLNCGEGCYYGAADAISFANSLIELDTFYQALTNTKYGIIGVGMTAINSHSYLAIDYVDEV